MDVIADANFETYMESDEQYAYLLYCQDRAREHILKHETLIQDCLADRSVVENMIRNFGDGLDIDGQCSHLPFVQYVLSGISDQWRVIHFHGRYDSVSGGQVLRALDRILELFADEIHALEEELVLEERMRRGIERKNREKAYEDADQMVREMQGQMRG